MLKHKWLIGTVSGLLLSAISATNYIYAESVNESNNETFNEEWINDERIYQEFDEFSTTETTNDPYLKEVVIPEIETTTDLTLDEYMSLDATTLSQMIRDGEVTSKELILLASKAIEKTNPELNNVITLNIESALTEAEALEDTGQPFFGVPILVKGMGGHAVKGGQNSNGLEFAENTTSRSDGRITRALKSAGFVVIGQTSFPQFGWINVTNSDLYGVTTNPWNTELNPGGSSGGSSAAVAIGQVPIASASDGGGSTRIPAAWSGLVGLHPTRSVMSYDTSRTTQQVTNFAVTKSMQDTERLFESLVKKTDDIESGDISKEQPIAYTLNTPAGTPISEDAVKAVKEAVAFLESKGYQIEEVEYPTDGKKLMEQYYILAASSSSTVNLLANQSLERSVTIDDVELLTWALLSTQKEITKDDVNNAWNYIEQVTKEMEDFHQKYPLLLTATTAYPAPSADYNHISDEMAAKMKDMSHLTKEEKLELIYDQWLPAWTLTPYTQLTNLTGMPSISLPTYVTENNSPLGIMFSSYAKNDRALIEMGKIFESAGKFKLYHEQPKATWEYELSPVIVEENTSSDWVSAIAPEVVEENKSSDWVSAIAPEVVEENESSDWVSAIAPEVVEENKSGDWVSAIAPEVVEENESSDWVSAIAPEVVEENESSDWVSAIAPEVVEENESSDWVSAIAPEVVEENESSDWVSAIAPEVVEENESSDWVSEIAPEVVEENESSDWVSSIAPEVFEGLAVANLGSQLSQNHRLLGVASTKSNNQEVNVEGVLAPDDTEETTTHSVSTNRARQINPSSATTLPNTGENRAYLIFGTTALTILAGLGLFPASKKEEQNI